MTATDPEVLLALVQNRAERLARRVRAAAPVDARDWIAAAVDSIATDLADVLDQLPGAL